MKAILTYHSIDNSGSPISLRADSFRRHAQWLASGRVSVLSLDAIVAHPADGNDAVAITFDDGFRNSMSGIQTLLADRLPVTVFVVSDHVGLTNEWGGKPQRGIPTAPLMSWDDLARLASAGASIEAHTRTHSHLTKIPVDALDNELEGSRAAIRKRLGGECNHFAYPYGDLNDVVAERVSRVFRFAHTTEFRAMSASDALLRLPRLDMYYLQAPGALEAWGSAAFQRKLGWIRMRRSVRAWLPL